MSATRITAIIIARAMTETTDIMTNTSATRKSGTATIYAAPPLALSFVAS